MLSRPYGTFFRITWQSYGLDQYSGWYDASCSSYDEHLVRYCFLNLISLRTRVSSPGGQQGREEKRIHKLNQKIDVNDDWHSLARQQWQASESAHCGWLPSLIARGYLSRFRQRDTTDSCVPATLVKEDVHCFGFLVVFSTFCLFPERIRIKLVRWWVYWMETWFL